MVFEIIFGITSHSMALLADGIHMGSHVLAIGLSWLAYVFIRRLDAKKDFAGNTQKILSLSGYSSGIFLMVFAFFILAEAIQRFFHPMQINYQDAILVALIGLGVNIASAFLLHAKEEHRDHNIRAAYLHVIADAFTSVTAIAGLLAAKYFDITWLDAVGAIVSSGVIIKWSAGLIKDTGKHLLDITSGEAQE